jgi:hypothetical protein
MRIVSNKILGLSMAAGAVIAAVGIGAHPSVIDIQAAPATPVHVSPPPPSPPPPQPPPPPARNYDPSQDYWTGQGSGGGAPGGAGGGG